MVRKGLTPRTLPQAPDRERWSRMSIMEQLANVSSEVGRAGKWKRKGNAALSEGAFIRTLDLIDATIAVGRAGENGRAALLEELCRARDLFCEEYLSDDVNALAPSEKYFSVFANALARKAGR